MSASEITTSDDNVVISKKEYEALKFAMRKLEVLKENGVDNWEGYGLAMRQLYQEEDDGV